LDFPEEIELSKRIGQGDTKALHTLVNSNLRLVIKIARPYMTKDVPLQDLIQEGNMGLFHAAEKFDHQKNIRFCTYASWWIRQFIIRYMTNKRRIVRLPHRKEEMLRRIQHSYHTLSQTLMHRPRTEDIADELGIPVQDVNNIINMSSGPLPLEPSDDGRGDGETARYVYEDYTYNPGQDLFRRYLREGTRNFLNSRLQDRERQVLSYRYRLDNDAPCTLKEIGDKLNLSPETIRQIEMKAMEKIRKNVRELRNSGLMEAM
jgi:RNA polymerase primary sigma factor